MKTDISLVKSLVSDWYCMIAVDWTDFQIVIAGVWAGYFAISIDIRINRINCLIHTIIL